MCSQDPFFGTNKIKSLITHRVNGPLKALGVLFNVKDYRRGRGVPVANPN